jgi:hypothetical protein
MVVAIDVSIGVYGDFSAKLKQLALKKMADSPPAFLKPFLGWFFGLGLGTLASRDNIRHF